MTLDLHRFLEGSTNAPIGLMGPRRDCKTKETHALSTPRTQVAWALRYKASFGSNIREDWQMHRPVDDVLKPEVPRASPLFIQKKLSDHSRLVGRKVIRIERRPGVGRYRLD